MKENKGIMNTNKNEKQQATGRYTMKSYQSLETERNHKGQYQKPYFDSERKYMRKMDPKMLL